MNIPVHTQYANDSGGCYFATSPYGWHLGKTPWEALSHLMVTADGRRSRVDSKEFLEETEYVNLWYIPDVIEFKTADHYAPVNSDNRIIGVPLFTGNRSASADITHEAMLRALP